MVAAKFLDYVYPKCQLPGVSDPLSLDWFRVATNGTVQELHATPATISLTLKQTKRQIVRRSWVVRGPLSLSLSLSLSLLSLIHI